jgi:hypothetical protein
MEKRSKQRLRTLKGGSIIFGPGSVIDCAIRNMSEIGAALDVESHIGIPAEFVLLAKSNAAKRKCRVAWRSAKRIGVQFI